MSSYFRQPKKLVVRCKVCPFVAIYFSSDPAKLPLKERGRRGLNAHGRTMHDAPHLGDEAIARMK